MFRRRDRVRVEVDACLRISNGDAVSPSALSAPPKETLDSEPSMYRVYWKRGRRWGGLFHVNPGHDAQFSFSSTLLRKRRGKKSSTVRKHIEEEESQFYGKTLLVRVDKIVGMYEDQTFRKDVISRRRKSTQIKFEPVGEGEIDIGKLYRVSPHGMHTGEATLEFGKRNETDVIVKCVFRERRDSMTSSVTDTDGGSVFTEDEGETFDDVDRRDGHDDGDEDRVDDDMNGTKHPSFDEEPDSSDIPLMHDSSMDDEPEKGQDEVLLQYFTKLFHSLQTTMDCFHSVWDDVKEHMEEMSGEGQTKLGSLYLIYSDMNQILESAKETIESGVPQETSDASGWLRRVSFVSEDASKLSQLNEPKIENGSEEDQLKSPIPIRSQERDHVAPISSHSSVPMSSSLHASPRSRMIQRQDITLPSPGYRVIDLSNGKYSEETLDFFTIERKCENPVAPEEISSLIVSKCKIHAVLSMPELIRLKTIDLSYNSMRFFPPLPSTLTTVIIRNNHLTGLDGIDRIPNLKHLDVSFNHIKSLSPLRMHRSIEVLNVKRNYVFDLHDIGNMRNLSTLDAAENEIPEYEDIAPLRRLSGLRNLTLRGNPVALKSSYRSRVMSICRTLASLDGRKTPSTVSSPMSSPLVSPSRFRKSSLPQTPRGSPRLVDMSPISQRFAVLEEKYPLENASKVESQ